MRRIFRQIREAGEAWSAQKKCYYKTVAGYIDIFCGDYGAYAWAVGIEEDVQIGRRLRDLREWVEDAQLWIGQGARLVMYTPRIARVSYILGRLFPEAEVWKKRSGDVGRVTVGRIEIRDYTAIGLAEIQEPVAPSGVYEWTALTEGEVDDIRDEGRGVLSEVSRLIVSCGGIENIPFSFSGYTRTSVRCLKIYTPSMTERERDLIKAAYQGGACTVNRLAAGETLRNVDSYDIDSSYIAVMLSSYLPSQKGRPVYNRDITTEEESPLRPWVGAVLFRCLRLRDELATGCIPMARISSDDGVTGYDYVTTARSLIWPCASPMVDVVRHYYECEQIILLEGYEYDAAPIPARLARQILNKYEQKEALKGMGRDYEYTQKKKELASYYGLAGEYPEKLDRVSLSRRALPYSWAPLITAYAQRNYYMIEYQAGRSYIYGDTDSAKVLRGSFDASGIELYNVAITEAIERNLRRMGICEPEEKIARLGHWERDGEYDRIKVLGRKCYIYEEGGVIHGVVSGVKKEYSARLTFSDFFSGAVIPPEESGSVAVMRDDRPTAREMVDRDGVTGMVVQPCIYKETPVAYTIGRDAVDDIADALRERRHNAE